jgi:peptidoglycan hydrolase-like protein with peptidoglycan-binding domain
MTLARTAPRIVLPALAGVVLAAAMGVGVASPVWAAAPAAAHAATGEQSGTALLRIGSRGLAVREWQSLLNRASTGRIATVDHQVLTVDGVYGPKTASATRAVQAASGIRQDGIVGPQTRAALPGLLPGAMSAPAAASERRLSTGARGGDVVDWQRVIGGLSSAGKVDTPRVALDGAFGPRTLAGTIAVQRRLGIVEDGIVGPVTRAGAATLLAQ